MRRRDFVAGLGSAVGLPLAARAQQAGKVWRIGFIHAGSESSFADYSTAFRGDLAKAGYVEGRDIALEFRFADGRLADMPRLAAELLHVPVDVILVSNGAAIQAAKAVTSTIPIVFAFAGDPVKFGFVASIRSPGGNMTGIITLSTDLVSKRLDLLNKIAPQAKTIAYLSDRIGPTADEERNEVLAGGRALGLQIVVPDLRRERDLNALFASLIQDGIGALLVGPYAVVQVHRDEILALAMSHQLPACYPRRSWVTAGGLMSYDADQRSFVSTVVDYTVRILKGAKAGDLPVQQPIKFELVISMKTAKTLGLVVPPALLALADEVIE
jgi:putative tryptophan/tyrosine transport system substrate-binding protein